MATRVPFLYTLLLACMFLCCLNGRILALGAKRKAQAYIVYLGERKHDDPELLTKSHHDMLTTLLGSKEEALSSILYSYKHAFSGFSAVLTEEQAKELSEWPEVISVSPNRKFQLRTTRSWDSLGLGLSSHPDGLLNKANHGEGIIVGVIDSGIWPESPSFKDHGFGPVPSKWKGVCQTGPTFGANNCSRKIIGARFYTKGVDSEALKGEYVSPRCLNCHGTHCASIAAGNPVPNISFNGLASGTARGGAPRARIAVYKVCWGQQARCDDAGTIAAIDDAVHDGVDLLSMSVGGPFETDYTLHAVARGITVVAAAGNDGPIPETVENSVPWTITAAASVVDRAFPTTITLGNNRVFIGQSIHTSRDNGFLKLVYGLGCDTETMSDPETAKSVKGSIVLCFNPQTVSSKLPITDIGETFVNVMKAGGKGIIHPQFSINGLSRIGALGSFIWAVVDWEVAYQVLGYASTSEPKVKIGLPQTTVGKEVLAPRIAYYSSRGPSAAFPQVLKPDIAAPGTDILAAMEHNTYKLDTGTSMACPHVSGVVALLKATHPDWSPAAIRSAMMTTASITDGLGMPIVAESTPRKLADPFDFGAGHINPNRAMDPGLVYDINPKEYYKFFKCKKNQFTVCDSFPRPLYDLNMPSIAIPNLKESVTTWRTVTNVGNNANAVYKAVIESPPGTKMLVEPSVLNFSSRKKVQTFKIVFTTTHKVQGVYTFGSLTWLDGAGHSVRIPTAVRIVIEAFYADAS